LRVYFGGCEYPKALKKLNEHGIKNIMFSFAAGASENCWRMAEEFKMNVLLDSGAFSAWSRGRVIDIDEYANYVRIKKPYRYFNLDVIGDSVATNHNQLYLESIGLSPIPIFHFDEPFEILDSLARKHKLIGLGGTVGRSLQARKNWLSQVYARCPNVAFHGLGVTHPELLESYPFYSVDSTWWLARFKTKSVRISDNQEVEVSHRIHKLVGMGIKRMSTDLAKVRTLLETVKKLAIYLTEDEISDIGLILDRSINRMLKMQDEAGIR